MKYNDPNEPICRCGGGGKPAGEYQGLPRLIDMLDREAEQQKESALKRLEKLVQKLERDAKQEPMQ